MTGASSVLWGEMSAPQLDALRQRGGVVLLPIGAVEQHGPHLPVDTDIDGAYQASLAIAHAGSDIVVAPPVWWGLSDAHRGFSGLLTLRPQTFAALLWDLCDSIVDQGFHRLVLVVAHGSNKPIVTLLVNQFMARRDVALLQLNYLDLGRAAFERVRRSQPGGELHAGELETALQLHLRGELVDLDCAPARPVDPAEQLGHSRAAPDIFSPGLVTVGYSLKRSFPEGVMGDPTVATAETGQLVWKAIVELGSELVAEYRQHHPRPMPGNAQPTHPERSTDP